MNQSKFLQKLVITSITAVIGVIGTQSFKASATPFAPGPRLPGCSPLAGDIDCLLPSPSQLQGKEYSNHLDVDDSQPTSSLDPEQNLAWDGNGGRTDTFDYSSSRRLFFDDLEDREVDALANQGDFLFEDVVEDTVWLLFSTDEDNRIFYENPGAPTGGIWAIPPEIDIDMALIDPDPGIQGTIPTDMDVDGLEVWGKDGPSNDDATQYSLEFDNVITRLTSRRVSVFDLFSPGFSSPHFFADELAFAICDLIICNAIEKAELILELDVDATMVNGDEILWSIDPFTSSTGLTLDGGEIFVWNKAIGGAATYLNHGGHEWNTDFEVMATFGTASENINALEAVAVKIIGSCSPNPDYQDCSVPTPEPTSVISLLALGTFGTVSTLKRKLKLSKSTEEKLKKVS